MPKLNTTWVVQPHHPLETVSEGILSAQGSIVMPLGTFPRRMTVLALQGGGSAIWSAIPLNEPQMSKIDALGPVKFLIVPNRGHRLDLHAWVARYPDAKVIAPPESEEDVREAAPVAATQDIINDPAIHFEIVPGMKIDEFALTVTHRDGVTLILNDILANVRHPEGIGAHLMARAFGFGLDRPRTSWVVRRRYVKDGAAVAGKFMSWAGMPDLRRIIVSHGDVIQERPREALLRAAADY